MAAPGFKNSPVVPDSILPTLSGKGYGTYPVRRGTFVLSFLLHIVAATLIAASASAIITHRQEIKQQVTGMVTDISPYILPPSSTEAGGGGGGDRDKLPAPKVLL